MNPHELCPFCGEPMREEQPAFAGTWHEAPSPAYFICDDCSEEDNDDGV